MVDIERVSSQSMDIEKADLEKLRAVFPQCFSEGKLDIDKLLNLCGEYIDEDFEKYKFEWKGKSECYRIAGKRSAGTLRPCPEESVNFDTTNNIYIEGDNLEVLKLLQSSYYNKVKMIYIDPPYNTGNDFVYDDDFKDPMAKYKEVTQQTTKSNPETMGRFHTNWLNMMYPRLRLAANLLRDDGVIFISIDENEITNLKKVCNEVFGEENYIGSFIWRKKDGGGQAKEYFVIEHEFIVVYRKSQQLVWYDKEEARDIAQYNKSDERGNFKITKLAKWGNTARREDRPSMYFSLIAPDGTEAFPIAPDGNDGRWRVGRERMNELLQNNLVHWEVKEGKWIPYEKEYFANQIKVLKQRSILYDIANTGDGSNVLTSLFSTKDMFENPKPIELVKVFLEATTKDNDIILDFFSGSATTAHAVMQLNAEDGGNRQFIMVQLPELCDEKSEAYKAGYKNICEIGKERIRRAGAKIGRGDTGFKVFKLDTSNLVEWDSTPTQDEQIVAQRFSLLNETIKPDRTDLDVIYEVMLKMGIPLTYKVISTQINDKKAYSIGEDCLVLICLDYGKDGITPEDIKEMCELIPAKIVSSEQAFKDSTALSNAYYILKDKDIEMKLL
ncbi:MAG TPA: site-specific DNA-methyltransferase [Candidatus Stercorousia faecigallinarum]|nr:site-specific DNA-methyltransferase [Candidatus Stercorousia faecigallinarum]